MTVTVEDICDYIENWAPASWAEDWDRVGLQFGSLRAPVEHLGLALELTPAVVSWMISQGVDCLLTHHPVFFKPLRRLLAEDPWEGLILELIRRGKTVISYHTNLDAAPEGVTEVLAEALGVRCEEALRPVASDLPGVGLGRLGVLPEPQKVSEMARHLSRIIQSPVAQVGEDREVRRVALCAGSGWDLWPEVLSKGAEVFITGEVKHHAAREAELAGVGLLVADHFAMENFFWRRLVERLSGRFPGLKVSFFEDKSPFRTFFIQGG